MQIKCQHPTVIINPNWRWLARKFGTIVIHGRTVLMLLRYVSMSVEQYYRITPRKNGVTPENVDNCYFLNRKTGETAPLYYVVPCGKCVLCRKRKSNELACRAIAETNKYGEIPLFLTCTYNDDNLPEKGLNKLDLQLFFKRLRARLDYFNIEHNIRYFAVGEYGSHTQRAHYHIILWNFPKKAFPNISAVITFIQRSWSRFVYKEDLTTGKLRRVPVLGSDGRPLHYPSGRIVYETQPIGFIKVLPVKQGCVGYITKYMRKASNAPAGFTPEFQLSSNRGGGIGSEWIRSQREYFRAHPDAVSLAITDKVVSGRTFHCPITPYVKSQLIPSVSQKLPKKDYDLVKTFISRIELWQAITERLRCRDILDLDRYDYASEQVVHWYDPFSDPMNNKDWKKAYVYASFIRPVTFKRVENLFTFIRSKEQVWDYVSLLLDEINDLAFKVLALPDYRSYICDREKFQQTRSELLQAKYSDIEPIDITLLVDHILRQDRQNVHKETF